MYAIGLALALAPPSALAQQLLNDRGEGSFAVMLGTDTALDGDPATFRLAVQGVGDLIDGSLLGLGVSLPVTWMTYGEDRFGASISRSVFEIPPSLRLRLLSGMPVRPYLDMGLGLVFASSRTDDWVLEQRRSSAGWMSRSAIGVEIGKTDGLMVVAEPFTVQSYHIGGSYGRLGGMIGVGSRF